MTFAYRGVLLHLGNVAWKHDSSACGCVGAQVTKSHAIPAHAELVVHVSASTLVRLPSGVSACRDHWLGLARLNAPIVSPRTRCSAPQEEAEVIIKTLRDETKTLKELQSLGMLHVCPSCICWSAHG